MSFDPHCFFPVYDILTVDPLLFFSSPCLCPSKVHFSAETWTQIQGQSLPRSHLCHISWRHTGLYICLWSSETA